MYCDGGGRGEGGGVELWRISIDVTYFGLTLPRKPHRHSSYIFSSRKDDNDCIQSHTVNNKTSGET